VCETLRPCRTPHAPPRFLLSQPDSRVLSQVTKHSCLASLAVLFKLWSVRRVLALVLHARQQWLHGISKSHITGALVGCWNLCTETPLAHVIVGSNIHAHLPACPWPQTVWLMPTVAACCTRLVSLYLCDDQQCQRCLQASKEATNENFLPFLRVELQQPALLLSGALHAQVPSTYVCTCSAMLQSSSRRWCCGAGRPIS
jgi:hypothetical protein